MLSDLLDRGVVALVRVDVEAKVGEEGEGLGLALQAGLGGGLEQGEVIGEWEQSGSRAAATATEPPAPGLPGDLLRRALLRGAGRLRISEMSDECIGEGLEDVGGEGPALREGAQVEDLAVDVDGEVLPVLWSDRQRVKVVL